MTPFVLRGAVFSECRNYRYTLWRVWDEEIRPLNVIGLNPSTADENVDDPTIRRCIGFARDWGFGGLVMTNLFALRSTDPKILSRVDDPVGARNDHHLMLAATAGAPLAAWGAHPMAHERAVSVMESLSHLDVECLGLTKNGAPRHPLYVPKIAPRVRFEVAP
jgi:hypothetical protein